MVVPGVLRLRRSNVEGVIMGNKVRNGPPRNCYDLPRLPTKVLLGYLAAARRVHQLLGPEDEAHYGYDPTDNHGPEITVAAIKAELAKRPHVPNKEEAREVRRQRARRPRSGGRGDR